MDIRQKTRSVMKTIKKIALYIIWITSFCVIAELIGTKLFPRSPSIKDFCEIMCYFWSGMIYYKYFFVKSKDKDND